MGHRPPATDDTDRALIESIRQTWDAKPGPRVGDFVLCLDGSERRFTARWEEGLQTTGTGELARDQSFYLSGDGADFSGCMAPTIPFLRLEPVDETREGRFWMFHHGEVRAHNGVSFAIPCRVFRELAPAAEPELAAIPHTIC